MADKPRDLRSPYHHQIGARRTCAAGPATPSPCQPRPSRKRPGRSSGCAWHQRCTGGRGEYPAGVLPVRSGHLPLGRLAGLPLAERPDGHLRQLQRPAVPGALVSPRPGPRAAPRPTENRRLGRRPPPSRSPGLLRGAHQPSGPPQCGHASARPDAADPFSPPCSFSTGCAVGTRRTRVVERDAATPLGHPSPVRERTPVVPGCGYRVPD